ncbi:hypothetical protein PHYBOEH_002771 [Phytophthora boehmeriae]|uniref:RxLR effector protein n=1 Tax=Phytophthora boehmeriae TaxID=109152 RepID=A0A8T1WRQ3_9STRA|nr:hypothetical protein PHYBOEH_002771 [Phytophthora boehmeriae]
MKATIVLIVLTALVYAAIVPQADGTSLRHVGQKLPAVLATMPRRSYFELTRDQADVTEDQENADESGNMIVIRTDNVERKENEAESDDGSDDHVAACKRRYYAEYLWCGEFKSGIDDVSEDPAAEHEENGDDSDDVSEDHGAGSDSDDVSKDREAEADSDDVSEDCGAEADSDDVSEDCVAEADSDDVSEDCGAEADSDDVSEDREAEGDSDDVSEDCVAEADSDDVSEDCGAEADSDDVSEDCGAEADSDDVSEDREAEGDMDDETKHDEKEADSDDEANVSEDLETACKRRLQVGFEENEVHADDGAENRDQYETISSDVQARGRYSEPGNNMVV